MASTTSSEKDIMNRNIIQCRVLNITRLYELYKSSQIQSVITIFQGVIKIVEAVC